ncbi:unnamed protein product, partial [Durusdinium trenchii]
IKPDIMHIVHLALAPDAAASVLLDLTDTDMYFEGSSRDDRLYKIWVSYKTFCEDERIPDRAARRLFTNQILNPGRGKFPEISQKVISAMAARYLLFWMSGFLRGLVQAGFSEERLMYSSAAIGALAAMELIMLREDRVLTELACAEFKRAYLTFRSGLNWLAEESLQKSQARWKLRPKIHQLAHLAHDFLPMNPRTYSNFLDEDFNGKTKRVAQATHPLYMSKQVAERYAVGVTLRWSNRGLR